ncbi:hypothetical protein ACTJKC_02175 [Pedobacter sp. 22226]
MLLGLTLLPKTSSLPYWAAEYIFAKRLSGCSGILPQGDTAEDTGPFRGTPKEKALTYIFRTPKKQLKRQTEKKQTMSP